MSSATSQMCMIAHVSSSVHAYQETLQVIQLASKIHRTKRRSMKRVRRARHAVYVTLCTSMRVTLTKGIVLYDVDEILRTTPGDAEIDDAN